jgi:hypothetical protein
MLCAIIAANIDDDDGVRDKVRDALRLAADSI